MGPAIEPQHVEWISPLGQWFVGSGAVIVGIILGVLKLMLGSHIREEEEKLSRLDGVMERLAATDQTIGEAMKQISTRLTMLEERQNLGPSRHDFELLSERLGTLNVTVAAMDAAVTAQMREIGNFRREIDRHDRALERSGR